MTDMQEPKRRGRPPTGEAVSSRLRQQRYRQRKRDAERELTRLRQDAAEVIVEIEKIRAALRGAMAEKETLAEEYTYAASLEIRDQMRDALFDASCELYGPILALQRIAKADDEEA